EAVDLLAKVPVQAEGRIKPLDTWAGFTLLRTNHHRGCRDADGNAMSSLEWLLGSLLDPADAREYTCFLIETSEVTDALGLSFDDKKKRDRYTYDELAPARERLANLGAQYSRIDEKERTGVQAGLVILAHNITEFEWLLRYLDFAREEFEIADVPALREAFGDARTVRFSDIVAKAPDLVRGIREQSRGHAEGGGLDDEGKAVSDLLEEARRVGNWARLLAIFPPAVSASDQPEWYAPADIIERSIFQGQVAPEHVAMLAHLEDLTRIRERMLRREATAEEFTQALRGFLNESRGLAESRGEYEKIELEVFLYRLDPFNKSLIIFLLAFVLVAVSWLAPRQRWVRWGVWGLLAAGVGLCTFGIVLRCVLRDRPPVSTLYETVLFITAFVVAACMLVEWINRQRIALAMAPALGAVGLFIAKRYEVISGQDTMPQLVAVLDTNFWLATHVVCITIGYAAALLAAALAHVYVLGKAFSLKRNDASFYVTLGRMTYGVLGFGLIFAVVGTILGGIWANDSWGRFWGWDPKENGALMIVLGMLVILHARMGGYLKQFGIAMATIFLGCIVAFSWWGVNLLGIGLHSYGFASGVFTGLMIFYAIEGAVLITGGVWRLSSGGQTGRASKRPDSDDAPPPLPTQS
ncbi:MAG: cytochrome c biogenesis protein, partial [Planctomycetota bacterium]